MDLGRWTRREFLTKAVAAAAGLGLVPTVAPWMARMFATPALAALPPESSDPWEDRFGGDDFRQCHHLARNGRTDGAAPSERVDAVVIGGGISGLAAAWALRDHKVVVLEKDSLVGGTARAKSWRDIVYGEGAAYISDVTGDFGALFAAVGAMPVQIPEPVDSLLAEGAVVADPFGDGVEALPYSSAVKESFRQARRDFEAWGAGPDCPMVPVMSSSLVSLALDRKPFQDLLNAYAAPVQAMLADFIRDCWGAGPQVQSAFAGVNFTVSFFAPAYGFPGGNAAVALALARALPPEMIRLNAFTTRVDHAPAGVRVTYLENGALRTIAAKAAILAVPKYFAKHVLPALPVDQAKALAAMRYGSYLVANVGISGPPPFASYAVYTPGRVFSSVANSQWIASKGRVDPAAPAGVLTCFIPMGEQDGRYQLFSASFETLADWVRRDLEEAFPQVRGRIEMMDLARWGHPMVLAPPRFITTQLEKARKPWGRISFGHTDMEGLPCIEGALTRAAAAADECRAWLE